MARQSIPSLFSLWRNHETLYTGIFVMALQKLSEEKCDMTNEDTISEHLCLILNAICFEESRNNNCEIRTPDWEKPISPVTENELRGGKTGKRPDFTCKRTNPHAACAEEHEISLHVECKRLGSPTSAGWILNKNYVTDGIKRFDCRLHEYGKRVSSGMMVGYIISMSPEKILDEVNTHQKQHCPYNPAIKFKFVKRNVQQYRQKLNRKNLKPEVFQLIHLWVDLRS